METIPSPLLGFLGGVFLTNLLTSTDNLTRTIKRQNTHQQKLAIHKKGPNKHNKNMLRYKTDRTWFSRLLQHSARKQSGPILTTLEAVWELWNGKKNSKLNLTGRHHHLHHVNQVSVHVGFNIHETLLKLSEPNQNTHSNYLVANTSCLTEDNGINTN